MYGAGIKASFHLCRKCFCKFTIPHWIGRNGIQCPVDRRVISLACVSLDPQRVSMASTAVRFQAATSAKLERSWHFTAPTTSPENYTGTHVTTRIPCSRALSASRSQAMHTSARKSSPGNDDSVKSSSPRSPANALLEISVFTVASLCVMPVTRFCSECHDCLYSGFCALSSRPSATDSTQDGKHSQRHQKPEVVVVLQWIPTDNVSRKMAKFFSCPFRISVSNVGLSRSRKRRGPTKPVPPVTRAFIEETCLMVSRFQYNPYHSRPIAES